MATFPSYAVLLADGFAQQRESGVQRTEMESGPPKQLKVKSRVLVRRTVVYALRSLADYNSFVTWFQTTVNFGADWFTWTDPVDSASKNARIVGQIDEEAPVVPALADWRVSFILETWSA